MIYQNGHKHWVYLRAGCEGGKWFRNCFTARFFDFCRDAIDPSDFSWVRFRNESIYALRGHGTKIKSSRSSYVVCYFCWMRGWFNMSSGIGTYDMSWAAFTKNSFRVLATDIWFDMILSFSESIITGSFRSPLFEKMVLRWARSL